MERAIMNGEVKLIMVSQDCLLRKENEKLGSKPRY